MASERALNQRGRDQALIASNRDIDIKAAEKRAADAELEVRVLMKALHGRAGG